jgi:hypothetical protein
MNLPSTFFGTNKIFSSPGELISLLVPNIISLAAVIFFLLILGAGFAMVVGAGKEANPQSAAKAKAALTFAVVGFLLVISAYFILQILRVMTGVDFLSPPTL